MAREHVREIKEEVVKLPVESSVCVMTLWVILKIAPNPFVHVHVTLCSGEGEEGKRCRGDGYCPQIRVTLTLLRGAVSEHEAKMDPVHFLQRDGHLEDNKVHPSFKRLSRARCACTFDDKPLGTAGEVNNGASARKTHLKCFHPAGLLDLVVDD